MLAGNGGASTSLPALPKMVTGSYHAAPSVQGAFKPPKAAPSVGGSMIDNPGGAGGYALQSTQNQVTTQHNANPDPNGYLTDPGYQGSLNSQTKGNADIDALLGQGLSNLFVQFGSPGLAAQLAKYGYSLTPNDQKAAQANYNAGTATLAQLDQAHTIGRRNAINTLAAHGLVDSGDLGYQLGQQDQTYANNLSNATNSVLGQAYQLQQNALSQRQQLQQQVDTALSNAWANFIKAPQAYAQAPEPNETGFASPPTVTPPPAAPKPKAAAVAKALVNPYVTGQKARG